MKLNYEKFRKHPNDGKAWYYIDDDEYAELLVAQLLLLGGKADNTNMVWDIIQDPKNTNDLMIKHRHGTEIEEQGVWQISALPTENFINRSPG